MTRDVGISQFAELNLIPCSPDSQTPGTGLPWPSELVDRPEVRARITCAVRALAATSSDPEDLEQAALARLCKIQRKRGGHTISWYVQNCRDFVRDELKAGRSLDSS